MKHKLLSFVFHIFLFSSALILAVSAHSGRTDSNGGHYNRSTGEYHYHHGYPAHQHTDLNGDGVIDCIYDFDDQTGRNSGGTSVSTKSDLQERIDHLLELNSSLEEQINLARKKIALTWLFVVLSAVFLFALIFTAISKRKNRNEYELKLKKEEQQHRDALKKEKQKYDRHLSKAQSQFESKVEEVKKKYRAEANLIRKYANLDPITLSNAPGDLYFDEEKQHLVKEGDTSPEEYGSLTVYISPHSKRFHRVQGCSSSSEVHHLLDVIFSMSPCRKCCDQDFLDNIYFPMKQWYPAYQKITEIKKKHHIP